jgi:two-component system NtrC family sensor kinase
VNNFSDINSELIEELLEEVKKGNYKEVETIASDIEENEQKILQHGRRADAIVKGMLSHSRSGSGEKEPTDINPLADEYLRLAYHGLRAKDKSFNADYKLEADKSIEPVMMVPQDIGRVILNLINNAFQAVKTKSQEGHKDYKPMVTVQTKKKGDNVEIRVKDNGGGIPDDIKEKIFEPFFTTKPSGEGTGLGLSMSYDIITKGHGGEIKLNNKVSEGTEFLIILPV